MRVQGIQGFITCALWVTDFTLYCSSLASAYILAAFTIEVYMAIVHPVTHKNVFNRRLVTILVVVAWIIGIGYPLGTHMGIASVVDGMCIPFDRWASVAVPMSIFNFLMRMGFPIMCHTVCYALIFTFLKDRARVAKQQRHVASNIVVPIVANLHPSFFEQQPTNHTQATATSTNHKQPLQLFSSRRISRSVATSQSGENVIMPTEAANQNAAGATPTSPHTSQKQYYLKASHNVAITVFYTLIIHVLSWTGNQVQVLMTAFGYTLDVTTNLYQILLLAIYTNSCVNPIVYAIKYTQFRRAIKRLIPCSR